MSFINRNAVMDETAARNVKALFVQSQNAFRWMNLEQTEVNLYTLERALRLQACRKEDLAVIEANWKIFCEEHNLTLDHFERLPDVAEIRGINRSRSARVGARTRDGRYVEETYDVDGAEFFS